MYLQGQLGQTSSGLGACAVPASVALQRLVCTPADRTAIGATLGLGRDATAAEVRTIITDAVRRAVILIARAAAPLRRPRVAGAAGEAMRLRFRDAFGTTPEFIPTWRPAGQSWDRGAVVRERLRCAAKVMSEGDIEFVCWGPGSCPFVFAWDAGTWAVVLPGQYRICLGARFWRASREGDVDGLATTLLHECLHIYFDTIRHELERGPYNTAACYERYVLVANSLPVPAAVSTPCRSSIPKGDFPPPHAGADHVAGIHADIGLGWSIPQFKSQSEIFLEKIKAIHETQRGVPLSYDQYPITRKDPTTGIVNEHNRWLFTPNRQNFKGSGEKEGSFCLGTARGMAFRSVFGLELPTYRKVLMGLRDRIETARKDKDLKKEADGLISRTVSHVHKRGSIDQFNADLESRYGIKNAKIKSSESMKEALDALKAGAPILVNLKPRGWHWVLVHRSPQGQLWSNDPLEPGVKRISPSEFESRFEIIVDANTDKPITPDKASSYKS